MKYTKRLLIFCGAAAMFAVNPLQAQTPITFDNDSTDGTYETDFNWDTDNAPASDLTTNTATLTGGTVDLSTTRQVAGLDFSTGSTLSGTGSIEIGTGGIAVGGNSVLNTAGLVLNQPNTTITFAGGRLSWGTSLTASGTGGVTLSGNNTLFVDGNSNTYSGGTTITGGASSGIKNSGALGTGGLILDNGTLFTNGSNMTFGNDITLNAGGGTVDANSKNLFLSGNITGGGALTYQGGGEQRLTSTGNTYSGGTTLDGVKVRLSGGDSLGTGDITLMNGGTIKNANNSFEVTNNIVIDSTGGGVEAGWTNKTINLSGVISGDGGLTINPDSSTVAITGGSNTYLGGTTIQGLALVSGTLGAGTITLDDVEGSRGQLKNNNSVTTLANDLAISANGGRMMAGWSKDLTINGVVSGEGALTIVGDSGFVVLGGESNTFTGDIVLQDASSKLSVASLGSGAYAGTISGDAAATFDWTGSGTFTGANTLVGMTTVEAGGEIGGSGSFAGDLTLEDGSKFLFSMTDTLTVGGTVSLFSGFGVDDLVGVNAAGEGIYTLIANVGDFSSVDNFGEANAFDLGGGKSAYFRNGSLELVVNVVAVPEPSSLALLGCCTALVAGRRRRRNV